MRGVRRELLLRSWLPDRRGVAWADVGRAACRDATRRPASGWSDGYWSAGKTQGSGSSSFASRVTAESGALCLLSVNLPAEARGWKVSNSVLLAMAENVCGDENAPPRGRGVRRSGRVRCVTWRCCYLVTNQMTRIRMAGCDSSRSIPWTHDVIMRSPFSRIPSRNELMWPFRTGGGASALNIRSPGFRQSPDTPAKVAYRLTEGRCLYSLVGSLFHQGQSYR